MAQKVSVAESLKVELFRDNKTLSGDQNITLATFDTTRFIALEFSCTVSFSGGTTPNATFNFNMVDPYNNEGNIIGVGNGGGTQIQALGLNAQANKPLGTKTNLKLFSTGGATSITYAVYVVGVPA